MENTSTVAIPPTGIISKIIEAKRKALIKLSSKTRLPVTDIRVKISMQQGDLKFHVMNKKTVIEETTLGYVLGLGMFTETIGINRKIENTMKKKIYDFSIKDHIPVENLNVRVFTRDEKTAEPQLYMFNGNTAVKPMSFADLV